MLDGKGASSSVIADTEVACIDQALIGALAKSDAELGMRLYQSLAIVLAKRLRHSTGSLAEFGAIIG